MNPVVISVCIMLLLALMRVNVVVALTFSAIIGGLVAGMGLNDTVAAFESGLGGGATIALSYAMLGTFAVAISKSGITGDPSPSAEILKELFQGFMPGAFFQLKSETGNFNIKDAARFHIGRHHDTGIKCNEERRDRLGGTAKRIVTACSEPRKVTAVLNKQGVVPVFFEKFDDSLMT